MKLLPFRRAYMLHSCFEYCWIQENRVVSKYFLSYLLLLAQIRPIDNFRTNLTIYL